MALQRWSLRFSLLTLRLPRYATHLYHLSVWPHPPDLCLQRPTLAKCHVSKVEVAPIGETDRQLTVNILLPPCCAVLGREVFPRTLGRLVLERKHASLGRERRPVQNRANERLGQPHKQICDTMLLQPYSGLDQATWGCTPLSDGLLSAGFPGTVWP